MRAWRRICSPDIRSVSALEVLRNRVLDIYLLSLLTRSSTNPNADCFFGTASKHTFSPDHFLTNCFRFLVLYTVYSSGLAVLYLNNSNVMQCNGNRLTCRLSVRRWVYAAVGIVPPTSPSLLASDSGIFNSTSSPLAADSAIEPRNTRSPNVSSSMSVQYIITAQANT